MKKAFLLTIIFIAAGCGGAPREAPNAPAAPNTVANAPNTAAAEPPEVQKAKNDILTSTKKLQEIEFWSAKTVSETLPQLNGEMEYAAPDRFRLRQGENEAIVIGKDSFEKENGKWKKSAEDLSALLDAQKKAVSEDAVKNLKDVKALGKETINGQETTVYVSKNNDSKLVETTTKTWISDARGLVVKSEIETKYEGQTQKVTTVYDYEKKVSIEAPKID